MYWRDWMFLRPPYFKIVNIQVYRVDEKKLIIFQLRSGILPGQVANYLEVGKNTQIIKLKGQ